MITGAHAIIYSRDAEADRAFLRDVLGFPFADAGGGWLIFGMPPSEVAVHPTEGGERHELYLMCDDVEALVRSMQERGVPCAAVMDQGWGLLTQVTLPGGGKLGVYEPRHPRAPQATGRKAARKKGPPARRAARKARKAAGRKGTHRGGARRPRPRSR